MAIALALRKIGPDALPPLYEALANSDPSVRGWAAYALGFVRIGHLETVRGTPESRKVTEIYVDPDCTAFLEPEHCVDPALPKGKPNVAAWSVFEDGGILITMLLTPTSSIPRLLCPWPLRPPSPGGVE